MARLFFRVVVDWGEWGWVVVVKTARFWCFAALGELKLGTYAEAIENNMGKSRVFSLLRINYLQT